MIVLPWLTLHDLYEQRERAFRVGVIKNTSCWNNVWNMWSRPARGCWCMHACISSCNSINMQQYEMMEGVKLTSYSIMLFNCASLPSISFTRRKYDNTFYSYTTNRYVVENWMVKKIKFTFCLLAYLLFV